MAKILYSLFSLVYAEIWGVYIYFGTYSIQMVKVFYREDKIRI